MSEDRDPAFEELLDYIKRERAFDFTGYKRASLLRRVSKRMQAVGVDDFRAYRDLLEARPDEFADLFDTVLINVTSFFRDKPAWEQLQAEIVPQLAEAKRDAGAIRVWSTGCATDVDAEALSVGRRASYPDKALEDVPEDIRRRYFEPDDSRSVFRKDLRRAVIFGRHDLIQDPPISRIDLLISRNTLIYFDADTQRQILANFHFSLTREGFLFLGKSE